MDRRMLLWKIIPGVILLAALFNARSVQGLKSATMEQRSVADAPNHLEDFEESSRVREKRARVQCPILDNFPDPSLSGLEEIPYWGEEVNAPGLHMVNVTLGGYGHRAINYFLKWKDPFKLGPWWGGFVPYEFEENMNPLIKEQVINAMQTIEAYTCLKFRHKEIINGKTLKQRLCYPHDRYVRFSVDVYSRKRAPSPVRRKDYDKNLYHSRFDMMKNLSEINKCYEANNCHGKPRLQCENGGYAISRSVLSSCSCICPPGLDPLSNCADIIKSQPFPTGPYAILQFDRYTECPGHGFTRKQIKIKGPGFQGNLLFYVCERNVEQIQERDWPLGTYCVLKTGDRCPGAGLYPERTGYKWVNETGHTSNMEMCCRTGGFKDDVTPLTFGHGFAFFMKPKIKCGTLHGMLLIAKHRKINAKHIISPRISNFRDPSNLKKCVYKPVYTDCGGVFKVNRRTRPLKIKFDGKRKNYDCVWFITATDDVNHRLSLDFKDLLIHDRDQKIKRKKVTKRKRGKRVVKMETVEEVKRVKRGTKRNKYRRRKHRPLRNSLEVRFTSPVELGLRFRRKPKGRIISTNTTIVILLKAMVRKQVRFEATLKVLRSEDMCYSGKDKGLSYVGPMNITRDMEPCLPWYETLHCVDDTYNVAEYYDRLTESYCRNPDPGRRIQPWCYTSNKTCEWNYCDACLKDHLYNLRKDCYKTESLETCPFRTGCAKTCRSLLPLKEIERKIGSTSCEAPTDLGDFAENMTAEIHQENYNVGDTITYKCKELDMSFQRSCLTTGKWSTLGDFCIERKPGCLKLENKGTDYDGTVSVAGGKPCLPWVERKRCFREAFNVLILKDNYCRNPYPKLYSKPWCFTERDSCEPTYCDDICIKGPKDICYDPHDKGHSYKGTVNQTAWGDPCLPWSEKTHCYFEWFDVGMLKDNYCRNPHGGRHKRPWCYHHDETETCMYSSCSICQKGQTMALNQTAPCSDFWSGCKAIIGKQPELCGYYRHIGERQCGYTCGFCGGNFGHGDGCAEDQAGLHGHRQYYRHRLINNRIRGGLQRGNYCGLTKGIPHYPFAGDETRICLGKGQWSGEPLHCLHICRRNNVFSNATRWCYKFLNTTKTYAGANVLCEQEGGHLTNVKSKEEQEFLQKEMAGYGQIWLGLRAESPDNKRKRKLVWTMDESRLFYANWNRRQPDIKGKKNVKRCAVMATDGKWRSEKCRKKFYPVCKIQPTRARTPPFDGPPYEIRMKQYEAQVAKYGLAEASTYSNEDYFAYGRGPLPPGME